MIIDRDLQSYLIHEDASIQEAASKVAANRREIVFCVDGGGRLLGSLSNGDIIRWIGAGASAGVAAAVGDLCNRRVRSAVSGDRETANRLLREVLYVPLVDAERHVVGVARQRHPGEGIKIGSRIIAEENRTFLISEIGNNHNGSLEAAFGLIKASAEAGADAAKFQMRDMTGLYGKRTKSQSEDLGTEYVLDLLDRFQLSDEDLYRCFDYTSSLGMEPLCTAFDINSADKCRAYGLKAIKTASADLTNHELLQYIVDQRIPTICSTGMSTEDEIRETVKLFQTSGAEYVMLHCNSTYPAPFRDINLRYMQRLQELCESVVGYSGHERDVFVSVAAVAMGARLIEKHFTLDREQEGNDHKVSLLPHEFKRMAEGVRQVEDSLGTALPRILSQGEKANRISLGKSIFAVDTIEAGATIQREALEIRSPGQGLSPNRINEVIGQKARRTIPAQTPLYPSDISELNPISGDSAKPGFRRPWGIPVRHRDAKKLIEAINPDFVEFHLSYRDLGIVDADFLGERYECGLIVHAPELFEGDHVLDLTTPDEAYRRRSIQEMQRVIAKTKALAQRFRKNGPTGIICNVGGFSSVRFLTAEERAAREVQLRSSVRDLTDPEVEIWPQTMPPYPWHFGGQRYHNLFVSSSDILRSCQELGMKICFDTSHSQLACTENGWSFDEFMETIGPFVAHVHMADARGVDGEGLQIGEGEIDFGNVFRVLNNKAPRASFIPEIWQGHENDGEGFRIALHRLAHFEQR
ncbi:N-acetylneuraminate synthase family protein [Bradyrhizobium sp. CCGB12]|uniref:N-acetylneuraminate synthase family protein n=1 Tax=Bradyrhizobium sp. CCGB12 TaxID=2949632 RepID=UPI0020B3CFF7|nr:N-acetylneuraminate synthase family protein [Bradyrhizobium sp. CCGB12]MCP3388336.1 N-acetylneuraminate synthase family protein [Bradyrhizobium sp. CCGB12]